MRKAFTLIELLVVVTVLPIVMVAISGVYATFIRDVPRITRVLQENTTVLDLLEQMRRDVDGAVGLPERFEGQHASERTLLIEQPGHVICYQLEDGRIVRTLFVATPSGVSSDALAGTLQTRPPSDQERVWRIRDAVITWRLWEGDPNRAAPRLGAGHEGRAYAVEIHSHVKQRVDGFLREKLADTQVFFLHGLVKEGEIR
ncbi:MAG: type II secretion system protein [Phycisphaerae bacterium]|nr:type II secretion system protein [Phycisphaerae bacterium]